MIQRFLFYGVQREAGGLTVYEAVEDTIDILPDAARAFAAGRDTAFIRAETATDSFAGHLFVIKSFVHSAPFNRVHFLLKNRILQKKNMGKINLPPPAEKTILGIYATRP